MKAVQPKEIRDWAWNWVRPALAVGILAMASSCKREKLPTRYVGALEGDTTGETRSILEFRADNTVRWIFAPKGAAYAVRGDTFFVEIGGHNPRVLPLVRRGDSLILIDGGRRWGTWIRAE